MTTLGEHGQMNKPPECLTCRVWQMPTCLPDTGDPSVMSHHVTDVLPEFVPACWPQLALQLVVLTLQDLTLLRHLVEVSLRLALLLVDPRALFLRLVQLALEGLHSRVHLVHLRQTHSLSLVTAQSRHHSCETTGRGTIAHTAIYLVPQPLFGNIYKVPCIWVKNLFKGTNNFK